MNCPFCGKDISVFILSDTLKDTMIYCEHCKNMVSFPMLQYTNRKCQCGKELKEIYSTKKAFCEHCYYTFEYDLQSLLDHQELDEIYQKEKIYFEEYSKKIQDNKKAISRWEILKEEWKNRYQFHPENEFFLKDIKEIPFQSEGEVSVRLRLNRNVPSIHYDLVLYEMGFLSKFFLSPSSFLKKSLSEVFSITFYDSLQIPDLIRNKFLIKQEFTNISWGIDENKVIRLYVGDEDHLRIDYLFWKKYKHFDEELIFDVSQAIKKFYKLTLLIDFNFFWQLHPNWGFLAKCPTNTGSGIKLYLRFPAENKKIKKNKKYFSRSAFFTRLKNFTLRGDQGENTEIKDFLTIGWNLPYLDLNQNSQEWETSFSHWMREILVIF
ncbi:MAG: hypothetical protein NZ853_05970 [Leptospiraceae bacterium]|nr:hypothetical protein [Leptospiraceae bacterium]MDW7976503.1 hypothetical protein [Leptospiraceae bacterium]